MLLYICQTRVTGPAGGRRLDYIPPVIEMRPESKCRLKSISYSGIAMSMPSAATVNATRSIIE